MVWKKHALAAVVLVSCGSLAAADRLKVESRTALAGQTDCRVRILADTSQAIEALACAVEASAGLAFTGIGIDDTVLGPGGLAAEWVGSIEDSPQRKVVGVIIDFTSPFDWRMLAAGADWHVLTCRFDVAGGLAAGTSLPVDLLAAVGDPPVYTLFTVNGQSVNPELVSGAVSIVSAPVIASVAPARGPLAGGTALTITGQHFTPDAVATVGGAPLADAVVVNATTITGKTPAHGAGAVDVTVANAIGADTEPGGFTYVAPPAIESIEPSVGSGNVEAAIRGDNFTDLADTAVTFAGVAVTEVSSVTITRIVCRLPACPTPGGLVAVTVTTSGGTAVLDEAYLCAITFMRGDANCDRRMNLADAVAVLEYLFQGAAAACVDALDANDDGRPDISDPIYALRFLFGGGAPPSPPFPAGGVDPTPDGIGCAAPCGA